MTAYQAGAARVSSTVTKQNPRPRKYATASERQAAYRARAPEVCFRAEPKTVDKLDEIAQTIDQSRADLLLSMTKFALANHDWARFGLTHRPLPFGYGMAAEVPATNPAPIWKRKRPKSLGKPVPLTPKQKATAKAMAKAAGRKYPNLVDNIAASRLENPTMKKPTTAQLAARAKFAEMARSGAFKRKAKANPRKKTVSEKISQLVREGYPQKQAVAVALEEQRAGKVKATPRKRNPITETLIYGLPAGESRDYMEELLYGGGLKLTPEQVQKVLDAATAAGYHSFRVTGFDPTVGAAFVRTMGQGRKRKPNPATGTYGPFYGDADAPLTEAQIERMAESYMDRLDRQLMRGDITQPQYDREVKALNKWAKEKYSKRKRNPATGTKKSRTKLNPTSSSRFKYVCIAPLEYSGAKYGIDERTPVTLKFTKTEPAAHLVYACYELPSRLVQNDDFQNFAYHNKVIYMSLAELKMLLKGYMK